MCNVSTIIHPFIGTSFSSAQFSNWIYVVNGLLAKVVLIIEWFEKTLLLFLSYQVVSFWVRYKLCLVLVCAESVIIRDSSSLAIFVFVLGTSAQVLCVAQVGFFFYLHVNSVSACLLLKLKLSTRLESLLFNSAPIELLLLLFNLISSFSSLHVNCKVSKKRKTLTLFYSLCANRNLCSNERKAKEANEA